MSVKEGSLARQSTVSNNDLVRVVAQDASRNITVQNFCDSIQSILEGLGFLTSSSIPSNLSQSRKILTINTAYNIVTTDDTILVDATGGDVGVNLPSAASAFNTTEQKGQRFTIKKIDAFSNKVLVNTVGSDLIDGQATIELKGSARVFINVISDGINWHLI